jgi:hypothetical protein
MNANERVVGFDWIRSIFIIFVLLMHTNAMQQLSSGAQHPTLFDRVQYDILCLAVPGFLLLSNFLTLTKCRNSADFCGKLKSTAALYVFWVSAWILVTKATPPFNGLGAVEFVLRGGGWAYYFFSALFMTNLICWGIHRLQTKQLIMCLLFCLSLIGVYFVILQMGARGSQNPVVSYWWPVCFIALPFMAAILVRQYDRLNSDQGFWLKCLVGAFLAHVTASLVEWSFSSFNITDPTRSCLPEYLRISLVFGSTWVFLLALRIRVWPWLIRFISRNSLGIFCFHVFWLGGIHKLAKIIIADEKFAWMLTVVFSLMFASLCAECLRYVMRFRLI